MYSYYDSNTFVLIDKKINQYNGIQDVVKLLVIIDLTFILFVFIIIILLSNVSRTGEFMNTSIVFSSEASLTILTWKPCVLMGEFMSITAGRMCKSFITTREKSTLVRLTIFFQN